MTEIQHKTEIRCWAKRARESLREMQKAIDAGLPMLALDLAAQAGGECGEIENILREQEADSTVMTEAAP